MCRAGGGSRLFYLAEVLLRRRNLILKKKKKMASRQRYQPPPGQITVRDKGSSLCKIHKGKEVILVCNNCKTLICIKCITSGHTHHTFTELFELASHNRMAIQEFIDDTEQNQLPCLRHACKAADAMLAENAVTSKIIPEQLKEQVEQILKRM